jgi:flagellar biosynthesis protein FlhB
MDIEEKAFVAPKTGERNALRKIELPTSKDMTQGSLFNLILKVLGIFFLKDILASFTQLFSTALYFSDYASGSEAAKNLAIALVPMLFFSAITYLLIFRTGLVLRWLNLDSRSEAFSLQVHRSVILSISIIVIGGLQLVNEIPELFRHVTYYVQERKLYTRMARPDISYLILSITKILIGLLLIVFNRRLVGLIEMRRRSTTPWHWPVKRVFRQRPRSPKRMSGHPRG